MRPDFYDFGVHDMYMTFCEAEISIVIIKNIQSVSLN